MSVEPSRRHSPNDDKERESSLSVGIEMLAPSVLRTLLGQVPFGVLIVAAPTGQLLAGNAEFERIIGEPLPVVASASAFIDRRIQTRAESADSHLTHRAITDGRTLADLPVRYERPDGSIVNLLLSTAPVRNADGSVVAAIIVCRENSPGPDEDQSTAIWVRADLLADLSSVVGSRVQESFLATAAHELRTPLTTVAGFSQLLERQLNKPNLDRSRLMAITRELRYQVNRMANLADDLMRAVTLRDDQVGVETEVCDVAAIARVSVERAQLSAEFTERHSINLVADGDVAAFFDPNHLDQVLSNLLSNALKFSPDGGDVTVSLKRSGDRVLLSVRDRGIGMSPEEHERLWQPFTRFGPLRRSVDGTGLGLYIVHRLVEQNGATITVDSARGTGSTFTVSLRAWPVSIPGASPD